MRKEFAEFFAGIGFVRLALESLGWACVFANDIDPKKAEIYRQNFVGDELIEGDIFDLSSKDVPLSANVWTASFPCIDLSLAGNRQGLNGMHSRTYWGFIALLESAYRAGCAPSYVIIENVVGFVTSAGGLDLYDALAALSQMGYAYNVSVVDARYFTPQSRPRLFILAEHQNVESFRLRRDPVVDDVHISQPATVRRFISAHQNLDWRYLRVAPLPELGPALGSIIDEPERTVGSWWSDEAVWHLIAQMSDVNRQRLNAMLASPYTEYGTIYRRVRQGRTATELRWDGLAGCLRTPRGGSSKQFLLETSRGTARVRNMSVRECARLQGAPDTFRFDVPVNQALFGLGDAVCIPAVRWLAGAFLPDTPWTEKGLAHSNSHSILPQGAHAAP